MEFWVPGLRPPNELAVGVNGNEGIDSRRTRALATGKKMPAPGTVVVKYDTLL